jgi:GTP-binding protein HflX
VGFISDLPTHLVAAFRATLEEVTEADLVVHVRDVHHPESEAQRRDVHGVLGELGLGETVESGMIEVLNKIDLLGSEERAALVNQARLNHHVVPVSAVTGEGLAELRECMVEKLRSGEQVHRIRIPATQGGKIAWLHSRGEVLDQKLDRDELELSVRLSPDNWARFQALESA